MKKNRILDTSGILRSRLDFSNFRYHITNSVLHELKDENVKAAIESAIKSGNVILSEASDEYVAKVIEKARETGDIMKLSNTDIEILAVALEKNLSIVTDDYSIQNVASHLNLDYEPVTQNGIKRSVKWKKICPFCDREYHSDKKECDVCGSKLRRIAYY
ncbi:MAG: ribonuclease VapC [Candidatus Altiarchaeales archaeon]|nr:MAG: ribonuclease VapC [Candidatus Altiarchaeales archaeon]RLI95493.1 MAG: ribonuclease VapC [Candidatus Altiarchaeales archaeon]HDO81939.1 ribonuclease VapC [Candidatus Altiarchaeales archaeon]HEX54588.1 ribonuclease VapC [Candidatus Altiarchaeales archaeon]